MAERIVVTEDEVLAEIERACMADAGPDDAFTTAEIAARTGRTEDRVRVALRVLVGRGEWECVKVRRRRLDGSVAPVPAYRRKAA